MKTKFLTAFITLVFIYTNTSKALVDSIFHQGGYRTFIVHLPTGYNPSLSYPLILNFHGLNSNAAEQELYTGFDAIADTAKFIVVYPQGLNNSWNLLPGAPDDVNFASVLIDSLKQMYSVDSGCVYSTGLSNGAFLSFNLGCYISNKLAAIAPVAGNMAQLQQILCFPAKGMPVMEIHGTADAVVSYNGTSGVPTVPETVHWWVTKNACDTTPVISSLPDINSTDGCTVQKCTYSNGLDNSEVIHYKVTGGGHTWPGAVPFAPLGNTCGDFNASETIWLFFRKYCAHITSVDETALNGFKLFPNPVVNEITISVSFGMKTPIQVEIINTLGQSVLKKITAVKPLDNTITLDASSFSDGLYFIRVNDTSSRLIKIRQ